MRASFCSMSLKTTEPTLLHTMRMPSIKPKSPMRFVRNALLAAAAAVSRVCQWPMSRYELTPTSSQKMNIIAKLFARTMPSIENMNSERLPKKRALLSSSFM